MEPRFITLPETKLIGKRINMSFAQNKTKELWQSFMPEVAAIKNNTGAAFYSIEVYSNGDFFKHFDPNMQFEKWAAIEATAFSAVPVTMETLVVPSGLYAVFLYKGKASEAPRIYQYIFGTWIPASGYLLDNRPHFAKMDERYKNEDPDSEEELWIPIQSTS